jgi:hypothetical protein
MNRCTFILLVVVCGQFAILAQPSVDLLEIRFDEHLPAVYNDQLQAGAEERALRQANIRWLAPIPIGNKVKPDRLLVGGEYANFAFRNYANDEILSRAHFQWLEIHIGYLYGWKDLRHSTRLILIPKWSTDGQLFQSDAFQVGVILIHKLQITERLALGAGGFMFRESFGWNFLPSFEVDWRMRNDWFLYGTLLGNMKLAKSLSDRFEVSASFWGPGNSINATRYGKSYIRIVEGLYSVWKLDLTWYSRALNFAGSDANTYARLSVGYAFDRGLKLYDASDQELRTDIFYPYSDGPVVQLAFGLRVKN